MTGKSSVSVRFRACVYVSVSVSVSVSVFALEHQMQLTKHPSSIQVPQFPASNPKSDLCSTPTTTARAI